VRHRNRSRSEFGRRGSTRGGKRLGTTLSGSQTVQTLGCNIFILVLNMATSFMLSRALGPGGRGEVAAAMLWPPLFVYLFGLGITSSVVFFAASSGFQSKVLASASALALVQGLAGAAIGFFLLPLLLASQHANVVAAGRVYLLVVPISLVTLCATGVLQGSRRILAFNGVRLIVPGGYLAGALVLVFLHVVTPLTIVLLHLLLNLATLSACVVALGAVLRQADFRPSLAYVKRLVRYGVKVQLGDTSQLANLRLDQVLMAAWLRPRELGLYVVAVNASSLVSLVSTAVRMVSVPSIAQLEGSGARMSLVGSTFREYWIVSLFGTLVLAILLPYALPVFFGSPFSPAVAPAEVLLVASFALGAKDVLSGAAQALGDPWLGSRAELVSLPVTVVLLFVLIPRDGIMGAAISSLAAYATQLAVTVVGFRVRHGLATADLLLPNRRDLAALRRSWLHVLLGRGA